MFGLYPAPTFLSGPFDELLLHLDRAQDGSEDAIHQARVGIRRFLEDLSLAATRFDKTELSTIRRRLSRVARALSRVRDADVGQQLIESVSERLLNSSLAFTRLRALMQQEREALQRKAIKQLEKADLERLRGRVAGARGPRHVPLASRSAWRAALRRHLASRAIELRIALQRVGSVYFPNRLHTTRIAIKRLRYAFELADRTASWRPPKALRVLKTAQEALGHVHDREILIRRLSAFRDIEPGCESADGLDALEHYLRAEIRQFHRTFLATSGELFTVCDACEIVASSRPLRLAMAAGVVVPSLMLMTRRAG